MTVAVKTCISYEQNQVLESIESCLLSLGGIGAFVRPGETVFLKLNLIMPLSPDRAATTHPSVVNALCRILVSAGAKVIVGDCPGYPLTESFLKTVYRTTGIDAAVEGTGATLNMDTEPVILRELSGQVLRSLEISRAMAQADVIINVPKLKTHGLTLMTGAVKNMFGVIPGLKKAEYHAKMPRVADFSRLLVDIASVTKPRLSVMDAIMSMEGAGPTHGTAVWTGLILASASPFLLDVVASHVAGVNPQEVPTIAEAHSRGLCPLDLSSIELVGDSLTGIHGTKPFALPPIRSGNNPLRRYMPDWLANRLIELVRPVPAFDPSLCTGCATCMRQCPPGAITMSGRLPHADLKKCIRCFCCHELCPKGAVLMKKTLLSRLLIR